MFNVHKQKPFSENHESLIVGLFDKPVKFEEKLSELDEAFAGELTELVKAGIFPLAKKRLRKYIHLENCQVNVLFLLVLGKEKRNFHLKILRKLLELFLKRSKRRQLGREPAVYLDSFILKRLMRLMQLMR